MSRYVALVEEDAGLFGVVFPQLPGCAAMGETIDEAVAHATDALSEWMADVTAAGKRYAPESLREVTRREDVREAIRQGSVPVLIPLVSESGRPVRANLSLDAGLLEAIDTAAKERGLTRSSWIASAAKRALTQGA